MSEGEAVWIKIPPCPSLLYGRERLIQREIKREERKKEREKENK